MSHASSTRSRAAWIVEIALIAALYVLGAHLRLFFPFTEVGASWVWIPSGISLAALLLRGTDRWPGIALGAFLVGGRHGLALAVGDLVAAVYATGEARMATALLRWGGPFDRTLQSVGTVLRFVASVTLSAAVTAIVGAWNLIALSPGGGGHYGETWLTFWVGDAMAMLTVTPTLLGVGGLACPFPRPLAPRGVCGAAGLRPSSSARWCSGSRPGRCTSCCRWPTRASR